MSPFRSYFPNRAAARRFAGGLFAMVAAWSLCSCGGRMSGSEAQQEVASDSGAVMFGAHAPEDSAPAATDTSVTYVDAGTDAPRRCNPPTFNPPGGRYAAPCDGPGWFSVSIIPSGPGATIFYTTDGNTPIPEASLTYVLPVAVRTLGPMTIQAIEVGADCAASEVVRATYVVVMACAMTRTPTISPFGGNYTMPQSVSIASDPGATILYTTDGSLPSFGDGTAGSTNRGITYVGPIVVRQTSTIVAVARAKGKLASDWALANFNIYTSSP